MIVAIFFLSSRLARRFRRLKPKEFDRLGNSASRLVRVGDKAIIKIGVNFGEEDVDEIDDLGTTAEVFGQGQLALVGKMLAEFVKDFGLAPRKR